MLPTDLYSQLTKELDLTQEQAEGSIGALLCLAQANLTREEFQQIADAIPAVSDVMGRSPRFEAHPQTRIKVHISRMFGGLGALAPLTRPLGTLQIEKKTIPVIAKAISRWLAGNGSSESSEILSKVMF